MSGPNVREKIHRTIVGEVLDALEAAETPLTRTDLKKACRTAANLGDVQSAVRELLEGKNIVRAGGAGAQRFQLPNKTPTTSAPAKGKATTPAPAPKQKRKTGRYGPAGLIVQELEREQEWLTIEQLEMRLRDLTHDQLRAAVQKSGRIQGRRRGEGQAHEYGLATWETVNEPDTAPASETTQVYATVAPRTRPNGRADRVVATITDRAAWMTLDELDNVLDDERDKIGQTLSGLSSTAGSGRLVSRHRAGSDRKEYGLPAWAESAIEATTGQANAPANEPTETGTEAFKQSCKDAFYKAYPGCMPVPDEPLAISTRRFALWSDGQLSIDDSDRRLEFSQSTVSALIAYLAEVTPNTLQRALDAQRRA